MRVPWAVWLLPAAAALPIVVSHLGPLVLPGRHVLRRAFWCPFRRANVEVAFNAASWGGTLVDVNACSAVSPPLACDKGCLLLRTFPAARAEVSSTGH